jgi:hypothetical protein
MVPNTAARWAAIIIGFPAEVTTVNWLLRPEIRVYQKTLETLLRSK